MSDFTRSTAQIFFQHTLAEVVRKLRSTMGRSEEEVIEQYLADTKAEVASATLSVKVIAVQKAAYFHMLGYSAAYAAFNVIEVMADSVFSNKRVGYVAACTTFNEDTDVILLLTALLKRDLASTNQYEAGMALYCISSICMPDMAKDLVSDVVRLLNHPRTYVRKKAVLSLYKMFLQYPECLRPTYPRLKDKLDDNSEHCDTDPAVRGAVVCVLCELARRNPANFLGLAVPFYSLLSSVQSNWTLIKVVKVFGYFAPVEPRLGKKLADPLTKLIESTGAKSVQYECLLAVANGMGRVPALTKLTAERLRTFVAHPDQNLKFLGLDALSRMVGENAKLLMDQRDTVLSCLDDSDVTIRSKALEVLRDLATKKNMVSTIDAMLDRCFRKPVDEAWSNTVIARIIETARIEDYGCIQDFEWYLGVLLELCVMDITEYAHGGLVENEIVNILARVNGARQFGVEALAGLLGHARLLRCGCERSTQWKILRAAAFACGEYSYWLTSKKETCEQLLSEAISLLPADVQVACVTAVGKIAAYLYRPAARHTELTNGEEELTASAEDATTLEQVVTVVEGSANSDRPVTASEDTKEAAEVQGLSLFLHSVFPEVQERATLVHHQVTVAPALGPLLFEKELPPIAEGAQEALEVPEGLDLETPFCKNLAALMALSESDDSSAGDEAGGSEAEKEDDFNLEYRIEQQKRLDKARREEVSAFYLREGSAAGERGSLLAGARDSGSRDPGWHEDPAMADADDYSHSSGVGAAQTPSARLYSRRPNGPRRVHGINRELVRPATYVAAQGKGGRRTKSPEEDEATRRLRNIDVTRTLGEDERLPEAVPYAVLLQGRNNGGPAAAATTLSSASAGAKRDGASKPAPLPPVTLFEEPLLMRLVLYVEGCKVKKDGTHLRCTLELTNLSVTNALHDVRVTVADSDAFDGGVSLVSAESVDSDAEKGETPGGVALGAKVKATAVGRKAFAVKLALPLPGSLLTPLLLTVAYLRDKKSASVSAALPLRYVYFAKRAVSSPVTPDAFNADVLHGALAEACVLSTFVPCSKAAALIAIPAIQSDLQLAPMDIFKDAATYCGLLHGRKWQSAQTHVAVLLREADEEGVRGLSVSVRAHSASLAELLAHDVATIIQAALTD